jgi:Protein of unknown function (DUF3572)
MSMRGQRPGGRIALEEAEAVAISALSYLSNTPDLMQRFLALSGIEASQIRAAASEPHFFAGVLKFFLAHEPSLLAFCEATGTPPPKVQTAAAALPGGSDFTQ